jgi:transposase InsO family protein
MLLLMADILKLICWAVIGLFRSRASLEAEILTLRQQLNVLRRKSPKRLAFNNVDRLIFVVLYQIATRVLNALTIIERQTVVRWYRAGFRLFWRWKSRRPRGRPKVALEIRQLIRNLSLINPPWGAPRIHGELLKLGIDVGQTSVAKYMMQRRRPPSQGWKTFLRNHADGITSMDLFVVPTFSFKLLYGLLILQHGRRQMLWLGVTTHPTAEWIARQLSEACGWDRTPRYLIRNRDRDCVYGEIFKRRLRAMGIRDRPTAPRSPWQNGHTERLIGSIRREYLDHVVVFGERHLRHLLLSYMEYYNGARTHLALDKDAPVSRAVQAIGRILAMPVLGGLHHHYGRV